MEIQTNPRMIKSVVPQRCRCWYVIIDFGVSREYDANVNNKENASAGDLRLHDIRKISIYSFTCLLFEKIEGFFVLHSS